MNATGGTIEAGMNARGWASSEDAVPIIMDIRRAEDRGPQAVGGGCAELASRSEPESRRISRKMAVK